MADGSFSFSQWDGAINPSPKERFVTLKKELPELLAKIGPTEKGMVARLSGSSVTVEQVVAYLARDGCVVVENAVTDEVCDDVVKEMEPYINAVATGTDDFGGHRTKRVGALVARSKSSHKIVGHPLLLDTCQAVLGHQLTRTKNEGHRVAPGSGSLHPFQLNATQIIKIGPGEPVQPLHRDRWTFMGDGAFEKADLEVQVATMWALDDWSPGLGGTRVVPGSHKIPADDVLAYLRKDEMETTFGPEAPSAVIKKGSVVIYLGASFHSGGANQTSEEWRFGMHVSYILGWLRQEENIYLACPPEIAKGLPPTMQNLIGYSRPGGSLGWYADMQEPQDALKAAEEQRKPLNWADPTSKL